MKYEVKCMNKYLFPLLTKYLFHLFLLMALLMPLQAFGQRSGNAATYARDAASIVSKYKREMQQIRAKVTAMPADSDAAPMSPYFYRLFGPGVFYRSVMEKQLKLDYALPEDGAFSGYPVQESPLQTTDLIKDRQQMNASIDEILFRAYAEQPHLFHYHDAQIAAQTTVDEQSVASTKAEDLASIYNKVEGVKDVADVLDSIDVDIQIVKPNFWKTSGKFSLQFTQNYFSENWYKGGNNNVTMLSSLLLEANYNDQKRVTWDNKLDLRLGFVTATSDSIHRYLSNNDKIQLNSKLGIKAAKNWFYTVSAEAKTQFLPGHKANDRRTYSKFLAPLDVYVSLGMDWKPKFKNGNTFSLALLPFSYKMRLIDDNDEDIHRSNNMVGKDFQQDFGSKIEFNSKITIVKDLTWKCRCFYFTSYEYVEAEMENVLSFQFNKYISSEVYTLWRFDDNRSRKYYDDTLGFFQFKEYFTLGLAYNF